MEPFIIQPYCICLLHMLIIYTDIIRQKRTMPDIYGQIQTSPFRIAVPS